MSTYPTGGAMPQYAKYIGEFVPSDDVLQYFYRVIAYDRNQLPLTNVADATVPTAWGPRVLDGNHAISVNWSPVIGASFFAVYKEEGAAPAEDIENPWWLASGSETSILDVGYPCGTRNSFLNPGLSPLFEAGCCGDQDSVATNVPPAGMAPPDDGHEGGGFVRMAAIAKLIGGGTLKVDNIKSENIKTEDLAAKRAYIESLKSLDITTKTIESEEGFFKDGHEIGVPAGPEGAIQYNKEGYFGGDIDLIWDYLNKRLGIKKPDPQYTLDIDDHV